MTHLTSNPRVRDQVRSRMCEREEHMEGLDFNIMPA